MAKRICDCDFLFHVGDYLEEELEARGWTTHDIAIRASDDPNEQRVIELACDLTIACLYAELDHAAAEATIGESLAGNIAKAFGTDAQTWLNLDAEFHRRRVAHLMN